MTAATQVEAREQATRAVQYGLLLPTCEKARLLHRLPRAVIGGVGGNNQTE